MGLLVEEIGKETNGVGKFQYYLLVVCGGMFMTTALSLTSVSFVIPSAQCDLNLTSSRKGVLSGMSMFGMLFGSYLWGNWADVKGRKTVLFMSLLIDATFSILSSISPTYELFLLCRFMCGFGTSGTAVVFSYLGEFLPSNHREKLLSTTELFWTIGIIIVPCIAWLVIPMTFSIKNDYIYFSSWNLFIIICSCPNIILSYVLYKLPESPKFLLSKGKVDEIVQCLETICKWNKIKKSHDFNLISLIPKETENVDTNIGFFQNFFVGIRNLMFSKYCVIAIQSFILQFGSTTSFYTIIMWAPELMNRFKYYENLNSPSSNISMCEIMSLFKNLTTSTENVCIDTIDNMVYLNIFLIGVVSLPPCIVIPFMVKRWGLRKVAVMCFLTSGIAAGCLYFVKNSFQNFMMSAIFEALSSIGITLVYCICIHLFPTELRGVAVSIGSMFGKFGGLMGNIMLGMFIDVYCAVPIIISCLLLILTALTLLFLPNTKKTILN
ncbi:synaptic vesicle glycoprotein 2B-like isoform X2 [Daktulosphaira vitifoliae]|uniref:synaptic vesicle glycoprotein 2B-like isoform X2 n=1 Tax=Daktulosphaira vitifoliae TaxID=58002 RepID=UPI0021A98652|nr:synaptic vesicle glycoprotein 2B-like isoform X2 [Daktulosphaira vitifoliae]